MHANRAIHRQRGAALIAAVGLLAIFAMLGASYLRYMSIEGERARWQTRNARADTLARDYLKIAINEVNLRAANGGDIPETLEFPIVPVYVGGRAGPDSIVDSESLRGEIRVTITDEAARLDINRAPASLIHAVTGVDEATAERIVNATRAPFGSDDPDLHLPVRTLEELTTRELLDEAAVQALPRESLTVYSGPGPYLNANTMPLDLLAAVLAIDGDTAAAIGQARPFETREALREKLEEQLEPGVTLHPAVGVQSRCYRLVCEATLTQPSAGGGWTPARTRRLEAVVVLQSDGPRVLHWGPAPWPDDELAS